MSPPSRGCIHLARRKYPGPFLEKIWFHQLLQDWSRKEATGAPMSRNFGAELWFRWLKVGFASHIRGTDFRSGSYHCEPSFPLRGQQPDELRGVDDFKKSLTDEATDIQTSRNLPSRDHVARMCTLFASKGGRRPLAIAKADHADALVAAPTFGDGRADGGCSLNKPVRWFLVRPRP